MTAGSKNDLNLSWMDHSFNKLNLSLNVIHCSEFSDTKGEFNIDWSHLFQPQDIIKIILDFFYNVK